jgi:hypothetical protein
VKALRITLSFCSLTLLSGVAMSQCGEVPSGGDTKARLAALTTTINCLVKQPKNLDAVYEEQIDFSAVAPASKQYTQIVAIIVPSKGMPNAPRLAVFPGEAAQVDFCSVEIDKSGTTYHATCSSPGGGQPAANSKGTAYVFYKK